MRALFTLVGLLVFALPAPTSAQSPPALEIGTHVGLSIVDATEGDSDALTLIGIPGGQFPLFSGTTLYLGFFPSEAIMVEPQISYLRASSSGDAFSLLGLTGGVKYLVRGTDEPSPFVGGHAALLREGESGDSDTDFAFGGSVGYRVPVREVLALTFEGRFRRWLTSEDGFGSDVNEYRLSVGIGAIVPRG